MGIPLVLEVFEDRQFWETELGTPPPEQVFGARHQKIVWFRNAVMKSAMAVG